MGAGERNFSVRVPRIDAPRPLRCVCPGRPPVVELFARVCDCADGLDAVCDGRAARETWRPIERAARAPIDILAVCCGNWQDCRRIDVVISETATGLTGN